MLIMELIGLCALFFLLCYLGTGGDKKNIKSYASYPDEIQRLVRNNEELAPYIRESSPAMAFLSNVLLFGVVFLLLGWPIRSDSMWVNFGKLTILGQGLNLFDFLVIDLLWWRNSPRVRFSGTDHLAEVYRDPAKHAASYFRGILAFAVVALLDGFLLTLF